MRELSYDHASRVYISNVIKIILQSVALLIVAILLTGLISVIFFKLQLFTSTPIFFYRGIKIILLASVISCFLIGIIFRHIIHMDVRDITMIWLLPAAFWLLFFTHIPVTADRAISIFLLGYLRDHQGQFVTQNDLQQHFEHIYVEQYAAVEKRMKEQQYTGTIDEQNGRYEITPKGLALLDFYDRVAIIMNINRKLLSPCEYSHGCS